MAFNISINRKWCKKCGLCEHYCPKKVYELDNFGAPEITRLEDCIGCNMCEYRCPDFAIEITKKDE